MDAFEQELTRMYPLLRTMARSMCRGKNSADDLVQEAMFRALRARASFTPGSNMQAWVRTIMRNLSRSELRRLRFDGGSLDEPGMEPLLNGLSHDGGQEVRIELGEAAEAFDRLTPVLRGSLYLVAVKDLSYEEGAAQLGVPLGTFKCQVSRARTCLQNACK